MSENRADVSVADKNKLALHTRADLGHTHSHRRGRLTQLTNAIGKLARCITPALIWRSRPAARECRSESAAVERSRTRLRPLFAEEKRPSSYLTAGDCVAARTL